MSFTCARKRGTAEASRVRRWVYKAAGGVRSLTPPPAPSEPSARSPRPTASLATMANPANSVPTHPFYDPSVFSKADAGAPKKMGSNNTDIMPVSYSDDAGAYSGSRIYLSSSVCVIGTPKRIEDGSTGASPLSDAVQYRLYCSFSGCEPLLEELKLFNVAANKWLMDCLKKFGFTKGKSTKVQAAPFYRTSEDRGKPEMYFSAKMGQEALATLLESGGFSDISELPKRSYVQVHFSPRSIYLNGSNAGFSLHVDRVDFVKECDTNFNKRARVNTFVVMETNPDYDAVPRNQ